MPPSIGQREREILTALVETYIATGEPIGSRTLSRQNAEGLSPATIRNVMSDLSEAGFLDQPHTSAGRVPTPAAYKYYVEQLSGRTRLSPEDESLISESLHGTTDLQEFMERSSHVLSLISHGVGVTVAGKSGRNSLDHVYFSRLSEHKVLAVVVTGTRVVRDRVLRVEQELTQADLDLAARFINDNFRGWTMDAVRKEIVRLIEQERGEYDRLKQSLEELYKQGALAGEAIVPEVYLEGAANLAAGEKDQDRLRQLLQTLEEKERVAKLLEAYLDTRQEAVRVVIGLEDTEPHLSNFVLIGAPARVGGEVIGSLAVLGPTRIDYQQTITAVSYIARLFDQLLNDSE